MPPKFKQVNPQKNPATLNLAAPPKQTADGWGFCAHSQSYVLC